MSDHRKRRITMVDTQVRPSDVTKFPVLDAMLSVPREAYVPDAMRGLAYLDGAIELTPERQLMEPRTIGKILQVLDVAPSDLVLEIGPGLGYTTALLAKMAEAVIAVEADPDLARDAEAALNAQGVDNAVVIAGAMPEGSVKNGPYDVIVAFGALTEVPMAITNQLKEGGRMIAVFMDGPVGEVRLGLKRAGTVSWRMEFNATAPILPGFEIAPSFEF